MDTSCDSKHGMHEKVSAGVKGFTTLLFVAEYHKLTVHVLDLTILKILSILGVFYPAHRSDEDVHGPQ